MSEEKSEQIIKLLGANFKANKRNENKFKKIAEHKGTELNEDIKNLNNK